MTKFYKISPKWKKSIFEYNRYENEDKTKSFTTEDMYRWGHCIVKIEDGKELADVIGNPIHSENEFEFDHSMVEDQEVDDRCSFYFQDPKGVTEEELDEKWEEKGHDFLEEEYGEPTDFWTIYHGELNVEDVTEEWTKND